MTGAAPRARRRLRPHWGLLALLLTAVLGALLLHGFTAREVGKAGTGAPVTGADAVLPGGSAVVSLDHGRVTSRGLPPRTVALTFDDGPDPTWTPQVLDVLRRERVPATFFVVGSRVADHAGLVERELADGNEVGSHTWTHADLSASPAWRSRLEHSLSQLGLAGAGGIASPLLRPPYSSTPDAVGAPDLAAIRRELARGSVVVLSDRDSEDWRRPGVDAVVAAAVPRGTAGAVVLFHDGGGDRAQTLAALPRVIAAYRAQGFRFATVGSGVGLPADVVDPRVSTPRHLQGLGLLLAVRASAGLTWLLTWLLVPLGALAVLRTLLLVAFARRHVVVARRRRDAPEVLPPVTVLVPAYDEAVGIEATVRSLVATGYPDLQVVVIDDGSTDGTADIVERLALPGVEVVRQANAGKAAALNTGLATARHDVLVMVDGDTVFEPDTLRELVQPLADPQVGAVSGNTKVGNRRGVLGRWQHLEYVVGFNLDRRMYDLLRCMPTVPGAIGAFRREALVEVGGVSTDTLAEDTDLTMAVSRAGWRVVYEERARAWTEAPSSLSALWRQRYRWCYGTLQAVWKHRGALRSGGPGRELGRIGLPYLLAFQVALPLVAPLIDVFALYGLVFLDPTRVVAYWVAFLGLQLASAAYALRLDGEPLGPLWTLPLQQFVYRQLMYLVVVQSVLSALAGIRLPWHKMERSGDVLVLPHPA